MSTKGLFWWSILRVNNSKARRAQAAALEFIIAGDWLVTTITAQDKLAAMLATAHGTL